MSNDKTGHRDPDGKWISETPQAKIRNRLSPFWLLSDLLTNEIYSSKIDLEHLKEIAENCEKQKEDILNLLKETED